MSNETTDTRLLSGLAGPPDTNPNRVYGVPCQSCVALTQRVAALEEALRDLLIGAEQRSQSYVDVAVKARAALADAR